MKKNEYCPGKITESQLNRLKKMRTHIDEIRSIKNLEQLSKMDAQRLIQKYQNDIRIPHHPITNVYGRDFINTIDNPELLPELNREDDYDMER